MNLNEILISEIKEKKKERNENEQRIFNNERQKKKRKIRIKRTKKALSKCVKSVDRIKGNSMKGNE